MPRAEVGSTKYIANQMKSKGLQRLRWYCQACQRQMRDENGFKCHVASESHVRQMQLIGEDPRKAINEYSNQFLRDFIQLLRTGHGEKKVNVNHFYQEYISNKQHIHMNATKWPSLTEFAKYLGREGICRVNEDEEKEGRMGASGLTISWIDNSPEALRRQDALRKKERQDRGDEEREQRMIQEQIRRARENGTAAETDAAEEQEEDDEAPAQQFSRNDGAKIVLDFGGKKDSRLTTKPPTPPRSDEDESSLEPVDEASHATPRATQPSTKSPPAPVRSATEPAKTKASVSISLGSASSKPKNVFAAASKKNALLPKKPTTPSPARPMSEAERIMKEELNRRRQREAIASRDSGHSVKKQRVS